MNSNPAFSSRLQIRIAVLLVLAAGVAFVPDAQAQTSADWNNSSTAIGTNTSWTPNTTPSATFTGNFNNATYTNAPNATAATTEFGKLYIGSSSGALTFGTSTNNITLSGVSGVGIEVASGAGAVNTSTTKFRLAANQTWLNNSSNGVTIGGTITNNSSASPVALTIDGTGNTTLTGVISNNTVSGQTSLTKNGTGTLVLSGANTFTGGLLINTGTVTGTVAGAMGANTNTVTFGGTGGGVLNLQNDSNTVFTALMNVASANGTVLVNRATSGAGVTHTMGGTTLGGGYELTVRGGSNVASGTAIFNPGTITMAGDGSIAVLDNLSNAGASRITSGGSGTTGTGNLTYKLNTTSGGQITLGTGSFNHNGTITNSGSGTGSVLISAPIGANVTGVTQNSANSTLSLSTANTYGGNLTILSGTVTGSSSATVFSTGAILLGDTSGSNNATLTSSLSGTHTNNITVRSGSSGTLAITGLTNNAVFSGTVALNNNLTLDQASASRNLTLSGAITQGANAVTITKGTGAGTVNISGATTLGGAGSTLTLATNNNTLTHSGGITGTGNLTLRNDGSTANGITISTNTVNNTGTITNSGSGSGGVLISSAIGSNVTRVVQNSATSTLTLSGANTYSGGTTVSAGVLSITGTSALPSWNTNGGYSVASGASLAVYNAVTDANITTMLGTTNFAAGSAIGFDTTTADRTYSAALGNTAQGALGLTKTGSNSLILTGANTYTGATTINAGTLQLGNNGATGSISASSNITINSGTLTVNRSDVTTISNRIFLGNGSQTISIPSNSSTFSGDISSLAGASSALTLQASALKSITLSGNLTVNGSVSLGASYLLLTLSGNNSASSWRLTSGNGYVQLSSAGAMGYSGNINMASGGLVFTNNSTDVSSRIVAESGQTYRLAAASSNSFTINSALTANGTNALLFGMSIATGTLVLGNSNSSFTGAVTIQSGTLSVAGIGNTGSNSYLGTNSSIIIGSANTSGALLYTGFGETTNKTITVAGKYGAIITANNPSGTLQFTSNIISTATASQVFTLFGTGMGEIAGSIGNNGTNLTSLTKSGTGVWTLSGNNTYSGATAANGGILVFRNTAAKATGAVTAGASGSIGLGVGGTGDFSDVNVQTLFNTGNLLVNTSNITLNAASGVAIDTTAGSFTQSTALTAARALTKLGNNTLTLGNGSNSYSGNTTIAAGTLSVASIGNTGSNSAVGRGSTINIGLNDSTGTLLYTGSAQTTNRTINLTGTTGGAVIDQSGNGLLRFTTNFAATGNGNKTLTLQGSTGGTGELSGVISDFAANTGTTALVKAGTGTWTLSGTNTYTGGTTLSAGVLGINATDALGTSGNITFSGGTMQFASGGSGANYGARIKNSASAIILDTNGQSVTFSTAIDSSNTLGLNKTGTGTLTLSAANTYTGGTTINAGTLSLSGASGALGSGNVALGASAVLELGNSGTPNVSNNISGSGTIRQTGSGVTSLSGTNNNTGAVEATAGTLLFSGAGALSTSTTSLNASNSATLSLADGTTRNSTIAGNINLSSSFLKFDIDGGNATSDFLSTTSGTASLTGSGKIQLNLLSDPTTTTTWNLLYAGGGLTSSWELDQTSFSPKSFTWNIAVTGNYLQLTATASTTTAFWLGAANGNWSNGANWAANADGSNTGTAPTSTYDVTFAATGASNLTTTLDGDRTIRSLTVNASEVTIAGSNTLTVNGTSITISATGNTTINANLAGTTAILTKSGSGTLTLNGSNTYAGGTSITGGTVVVGSSTALGNSTGAVNLNPGAGNTITLRSGASGLALANNMALSSGTTVFDTNSNNTTLYGVLSSGGALTKSGAGILTLTANNTHTGGITISAGGIALSGSGALADSEAVNLSATGTSFDISAITASGETIASITGASGSTIGLGAKTLTVGGDDTSTTFSGSIGGAGGALVKTGSGTLMLDGGNTYTGTTTISAGGIQIGNGGTTGSLSTSSTITNNGVLTFNRSNNVVQGTDFTSTAIGGSGSLVQSGSGNLTLSSANTYSGGTTLNSGTLVLNNSTAIGTGALSINGGTLNNTSGSSITLTSNNTQNWNANFAFTGTNDLNLGTGAVAIGNAASRTVTLNSGNLTVGGAISGTSSLTKAGAGTLRLTGSNSYSGGTTISAGILEIAGSGTLNAAGNIVNNGTLLWNSSNSPTFSGIISGSGGITLNGTGRMQLSSSNSFTGGVVINAGTLRFGGINVISASNNVTINGGTLDGDAINRTNTISLLTLSSGNVSQNTLTATNGYILQNGSVSAILAGTGTLTKNGSGTVTLSGINTISGTTTVSDGTLVLSGNGTLGTSTITITGGTLDLGGKSLTNTFGSLTGGTLSNGTITNNGGNYALQNGTVSAILAGTNGVNKTGSGTVTLTGSNTYSGTTTIAAGTLLLSGTGTLGTSAISISGGTLNMGGKSLTNTLGSLTGGTLSNGTLTNNSGNYDLQNGTVSAVLAGTNGVNKTTSGSVTLTGANTYTGTTTISSGTLNAAAAGAMGNSTVINVTGGSFLVTAENAVNDNANINLGGGTLAVSGTFNENVGLLTLSANSTIDLNNFTGILRFGGVGSWAPTANLAIWNWNGTPLHNPGNLPPSGGTRPVVFADNTGLDNYLNRINFYSDSGNSFIGNAFEQSFTQSGFEGSQIIAVPEPETYLTGVLLILGATIYQLRIARHGRGLLRRLAFLRPRTHRKPLEGQPPA